jgi:hypothetical protein
MCSLQILQTEVAIKYVPQFLQHPLLYILIVLPDRLIVLLSVSLWIVNFPNHASSIVVKAMIYNHYYWALEFYVEDVDNILKILSLEPTMSVT